MGAFCEVFGQTPRLKVLEFFLEGRELDFGIAQVAEDVEQSRATTYAVCDELIKQNVILPTRRIANAQLYKLNTSKPEVQILLKAFRMVLHMIAKEYEEKELLAAPRLLKH